MRTHESLPGVNNLATSSKKLPDPLVFPLTDNEKLVEFIAEVTGESLASVGKQLWDEEYDLGRYHRADFAKHGLQPHVWDERMDSYYRQLSVWLPSFAVWNRRPEKLKMRQWIGEFLASRTKAALRILTVGDGAGYDSLYLSQCGHRVDYWELSERAIAFAEKIFRHEAQPVHIIRAESELTASSYDVIVCLDVLEHVPDPVPFVQQLASYLQPGGLFITHAPFFFVTYHCPTHLRCNRQFSGEIKRLYGSADLHPIAGRFFWTPLALQKIASGSHETPPRLPWLPRIGGWLLSIGRYWSWPHEWMAIRARGNVNPKWREGLEKYANV